LVDQYDVDEAYVFQPLTKCLLYSNGHAGSIKCRQCLN